MTRTLDDIMNETPDQRRRRIAIDMAYDELRTWRVRCAVCGMSIVTQSPEKPTDLPEGWDVKSYGVACLHCGQITNREGTS